jgi:hypothetical protein
VFEKNTQLLPLDFSGYSPGVFLYNRLLWIDRIADDNRIDVTEM